MLLLLTSFWAHLRLCTVGSYASLSVRLSVTSPKITGPKFNQCIFNNIMTIAKCNSRVKLKSFLVTYIDRCSLFNVKLHFFLFMLWLDQECVSVYLTTSMDLWVSCVTDTLWCVIHLSVTGSSELTWFVGGVEAAPLHGILWFFSYLWITIYTFPNTLTPPPLRRSREKIIMSSNRDI